MLKEVYEEGTWLYDQVLNTPVLVVLLCSGKVWQGESLANQLYLDRPIGY